MPRSEYEWIEGNEGCGTCAFRGINRQYAYCENSQGKILPNCMNINGREEAGNYQIVHRVTGEPLRPEELISLYTGHRHERLRSSSGQSRPM